MGGVMRCLERFVRLAGGVALVLCLGACGHAYVIEPARLVLTPAEELSAAELRGAIGPALVSAGFDDLGIDEEMIDLQRRTAPDARTAALRADPLLHEYTYFNERRKIRVEIIDYTDVDRPRRQLPYETPSGPFFEIRISEERPGGFSTSGHRFLTDLQRQLATLEAAVILVVPPPATDNATYWRITLSNFVGGAMGWLTVFSVSMALTGTVSYAVLKRIPISITAKRSSFAAINAWLVTPLPFPAASILVILLPHLAARPWTDLDYYHRVLDYAVVSFPVSIALLALLANALFPAPSAREVAGSKA
jgi:hypothetical protein